MDWIQIALIPIVGGIVGFGVWYMQSAIESIRRERERLHDERRKIYADLLEPYMRMIGGTTKPSDKDRAMRQITSFEYRRAFFEVAMMGSDEVVTSLNEMMQYFFKTSDEGGTAQPVDFIGLFGGFLLAIRRDLGQADTQLSEVDMLRMMIKDIDKFATV